jgi:phosphoenolpyruvate-protein phosphotransferase (PTS system enzyme I)
LAKNFKALWGAGVGTSARIGEVVRARARPNLSKPQQAGELGNQHELLSQATEKVAQRLKSLRSKTLGEPAAVFESIEAIVRDRDLAQISHEMIDSGVDAGRAFSRALDFFASQLEGTAVFQDRVADLRDLEIQVHAELAGVVLDLELPEQGEFVLVAGDISAVQAMRLPTSIAAVITKHGAVTSHAAIICRSKSIPMLVACQDADTLVEGESVLVDPLGNRVLVGAGLESATKALSFTATFASPIIPVMANIGSQEEALAAASAKSGGVGLVRTELLFLEHSSSPTVEEQAEIYARLFELCPNGPISARTFDNAKDKGLRFALGAKEKEQIEDQLQALEQARVASGREIWVMAPMIEGAAQATRFARLARERGSFPVGVMVERASLIEDLPKLAGTLNFISVGTNDLLADLSNTERLTDAGSGASSHWQPSLISALADIASYANAAGLHSSVCGESASDPSFAIVLAGLGFDSVSSSPSQVGQVRAALSSLDKGQAVDVAKAALEGLSADESKSLALAKLAGFEG